MQNLSEFVQTKLYFDNLSQPIEDYLLENLKNSIDNYDVRFGNDHQFFPDGYPADNYNEYLYESLLRSYNLDKFIDKLRKIFSIQQEQVFSKWSVGVLIGNGFDKNNPRFISLCNLYNVFISEEKKPYPDLDLTWVVFDQTKPDNVTDDIYRENEFLYHITNHVVVDKILKYGLQPKSHSKKSYHPERIYLFTSYTPINVLKNMMNQLNGDTLLKINIQKFKREYKQKLNFYIDPSFPVENNEYIAVFTENTIYPTVIEEIK